MAAKRERESVPREKRVLEIVWTGPAALYYKEVVSDEEHLANLRAQPGYQKLGMKPDA